LAVIGADGDGKSTLIERLREEAGSLPLDQRAGSEGAGQIEIDLRDYIVLHAPDRRDYLRELICGEHCADAAILVVDVADGMGEEARRHGYLLHLLGIGQVAVAINKMDLVGFDQEQFLEVSRDVTQYLSEIGITPAFVVPVSARGGDNLVRNSQDLPWYDGPSLLESLEHFQIKTLPADQPLRLPIQDVSESNGCRTLSGRIEAGVLRVGDTLALSPSNRTARVRSIESVAGTGSVVEARAGMSVEVALDEKVYVEPGEMASHKEALPQLTTVFRTALFWLGDEPLYAGKTYRLQVATQTARVTIQSIEHVIDADTLAERPDGRVERNCLTEVILRSRQVLAIDEFREIATTGRCTLLEDSEVVAGGLISMEGYPDQRQGLTVKSTNITSVEHRVTAENRFHRNGHGGGVLWFTGLSGAGKSTLAMAVEQHLFKKGFHVYVLDGDNVRRGLNANLGFSPDDRAENIRRIGEVASLFAESGIICITAFISPYQSDRDRARAAAGENFHEIYIEADLQTCEERDPKGLYRKARAGEIQDFTGISAPYEPPIKPELMVDTAHHTVDECVQQIADYVNSTFVLASGAGKDPG
jgi:bifunctional enzyme CysN/CysC